MSYGVERAPHDTEARPVCQIAPGVRKSPHYREPVPLQNRVTPYGDLVAVPERGVVYGNRGCLHDTEGLIQRHHSGLLPVDRASPATRRCGLK